MIRLRPRPTRCLTPGAQYAIDIGRDSIQIVVTGSGFQSPQAEAEAERLEDCLHDAVEAVLARHWRNPADSALANTDRDL